jgi:hypothetical protein
MERARQAAIFFVLLFWLSSAFAGERDALLALERIKEGIRSGVTYETYCQLIDEAKKQIYILKRYRNADGSFLDAVELSYDGFNVAKSIWKCSLALDKERIELSVVTNNSSKMREIEQKLQRVDEDLQTAWDAAVEALDLAYQRLK